MEITKGTKVVVTGASSTEAGTAGVVKLIRNGWTMPEAVVTVPGWHEREFTVPLADLSPADQVRHDGAVVGLAVLAGVAWVVYALLSHFGVI